MCHSLVLLELLLAASCLCGSSSLFFRTIFQVSPAVNLFLGNGPTQTCVGTPLISCTNERSPHPWALRARQIFWRTVVQVSPFCLLGDSWGTDWLWISDCTPDRPSGESRNVVHGARATPPSELTGVARRPLSETALSSPQRSQDPQDNPESQDWEASSPLPASLRYLCVRPQFAKQFARVFFDWRHPCSGPRGCTIRSTVCLQ